MTADAKIGLLLGLVFIFVIAFIINGLPNFGNRPQAADGATMPEFQDDRIGVADSAQEQFGFDEILGGSVAEDPEPTTTELESTMPETETAVAIESGQGQGARAVYELPSIDSLVNGMHDMVNTIAERAGTVVATEVATEVPSGTIHEEPRTTMSLSDVIAPAAEQRRSEPEPEPEPARPTDTVEVRDLIQKIKPKVYVVQKGDVLATVAKKAYGDEEGNRLVNIKRIYEANRNVLKSPDEIIEGQKLMIPPLPEGKKNDQLTHSLLEKVEAVGQRNLPSTPKASGRTYTVREDDSFWKIASEELGSGARWKEIAQLNGLKEDATLKIGSELKLPAK